MCNVTLYTVVEPRYKPFATHFLATHAPTILAAFMGVLNLRKQGHYVSR
jgi:hypothetical protein